MTGKDKESGTFNWVMRNMLKVVAFTLRSLR